MWWKLGERRFLVGMQPIQKRLSFANLRPRLHGTARIWNRAEIRPFRPCNTREPRNRTNFRPPTGRIRVYKQAKKDEFQTGPKFVRYRINGVLNSKL